MEKIDKLEKVNKDKDPNKHNGIRIGNGKFKNKQNGDPKPIYNNNKNHKRWRLQDGRLLSKVFFSIQ
jgi:hypothetical protein